MMSMRREENNNNNNGGVSISRVMSVHPKIVEGERVIELSSLDRQCPSLMYSVLFYDKKSVVEHDDDDDDISVVMSRLKLGLEETLSLWYPAAGRLIKATHNNDGKVNVWCNNKGAIMVEAHTCLAISQLGDLSRYNLETLVYRPPFPPNDLSSMPLVVAQVTKFGCGGYSIGIGTSHALFDGRATYEFLCAWASNSQTTLKGTSSGGDVATTTTTIKPVHERGILLSSGNNVGAPKGTTEKYMAISSSSSSSSDNNNNHDQQEASKADAIDHIYQLIMQAVTEDNTNNNNKGFVHRQITQQNNNNNCVLMTYHVSPSLINDLKTKHFSVNSASLLSTFELLASHLWKARSLALGVGKEKKVCLQFAVDSRKKMSPPLPNGFSGNAYVLASVMMSAGEVEKATYECIVDKIREAKKRVTHSYVKSYIESLESQEKGEGQCANSEIPAWKELTMVSDLTRMPFEDVGFFGSKAAYASPLAAPILHVAYFIHNQQGLHLIIGLPPQALSAFPHYFLCLPQ